MVDNRFHSNNISNVPYSIGNIIWRKEELKIPFETARRIKKAYYDNEFITMIVYGPFGYGKSSFAIQVQNELYGWWKYEKDGTITYADDWKESFQKHVFFHPKDFIYHCCNSDGKREMSVCWDDAGYWLHALEFTDPMVMAVGKYLNVARTDWAAIIFTAPLPTWITKKIRDLPQATTIKVIKVSSNVTQKDDRRGKAYQYWVAPDMKKSGVREIYQDDFRVKLPQEVYDFYQPMRAKYARMASQEMMKELLQIEKDEKKKVSAEVN